MRLVDGEVVRVPGGDPVGALVHHGDGDVRTLLGDHAAGRPAHVARAQAADPPDAAVCHFHLKNKGLNNKSTE